MECTCYLGACVAHMRLDPPRLERRALTPAHRDMMRRHDSNDWPDDKTQYTSAETRLLLEAWQIVDEARR